jgi:hydroxymethylbilane synthase
MAVEIAPGGILLMLTIGSRGSQLALWQARWIQGRLASLGEESRIEIIHTTGDRITDVALSKVGTKGLFTKEIEEALLRGDIDVAVHSMKDMPTEVPAGLTVAAIPEREDARDALVGKCWHQLDGAARVGTSSLRRAAQLRALRPALAMETIRGNVDTRLRKLDEGRFDAIVLAAAGLRRLGLGARIAEVLDPDFMCPAVGQGALAVQTRMDDGRAFEVCARLDDAKARVAVTAERALLAKLGGGCQVPIGAHARVLDGRLRMDAVVVTPDGARTIRRGAHGSVADAEAIGCQLGADLLEDGAREILDAVYGGAADAGLRT